MIRIRVSTEAIMPKTFGLIAAASLLSAFPTTAGVSTTGTVLQGNCYTVCDRNGQCTTECPSTGTRAVQPRQLQCSTYHYVNQLPIYGPACRAALLYYSRNGEPV